MNVSTPAANINSDTTNVYVYGDYNPTYLYKPRVSELHLINNAQGALWNPKLEEIPATLHAAVMKQAGIAILYDGWVDLEHVGVTKPEGATRAGEVLGYDIYAQTGECYVGNDKQEGADDKPPVFSTGGTYSGNSSVNYTWAIVQMYRALGIEFVEYYVTTEKAPDSFDINRSPLAQYLTMATSGPDLSAAISNVAVTRTDPTQYLQLADTDCIEVGASSELTLTVAEFCQLASTLMHLYGEPVITEQETYMLLEAYGQELPYDLPSVQLDAVKYLMARGIVESDCVWSNTINFDTASTILMRIKDKDSRLTLKEVQLNTDTSLLAKGYYPTTVSNQVSPIEVLDVAQSYDTYLYYDYFVEYTDECRFRTAGGLDDAVPFVGVTDDNNSGVLPGSVYRGRYKHSSGREFYHFLIRQNVSPAEGAIYINTRGDNDAPFRYTLSAAQGGCWLYVGDMHWEYVPLNNVTCEFPLEYLDVGRKDAHVADYGSQLSLLNAAAYGYTFRVHKDNLKDVTFVGADKVEQTLASIKDEAPIKLAYEGLSIRKEKVSTSEYPAFTVVGCSNRETLAEVLTCAGESSIYQSFPAYANHDSQYLVSVEFLKARNVIWDFQKLTDNTYYLGVRSTDSSTASSLYTDVYIGTSASGSYVIRGSQVTVYEDGIVPVYEMENSFYVDYSVIHGSSGVIAFRDEKGARVLTDLENGLEGVTQKKVYNTNNVESGACSEWAAYVDVRLNADTKRTPYIYCPITYPLANWLTVENRRDGRRGMFTFFADSDPDADPTAAEVTGATMLRSMLGASMTETNWSVYYEDSVPLGSVSAKWTANGYVIDNEKLKEPPPLAYIQEYNAILIKPNIIGEGFENYGEFVMMSKEDVGSSLVMSIDDNGALTYLGDWNYNRFKLSEAEGYRDALVRHIVCVEGDNDNDDYYVANYYCDLSTYAGGSEFGCKHTNSSYYTAWIPAPVGVPGLLGYPATTSTNLRAINNFNIYSGTTYTVRGVSNQSVYVAPQGGAPDPTQILKYSIIHFTPNAAWAQSCGFTFEFEAGSPLAGATDTKPTLSRGTPIGTFDWGQFYQDIGLQNADDWLTIMIIAVLNILPRILMFLFIILMALAMVSNVKPWQAFCDNVFDPYKFLSLGRRDVHTTSVRSVVVCSMIALILFGLFQNGLILEIIAWVARAVTGILSR